MPYLYCSFDVTDKNVGAGSKDVWDRLSSLSSGAPKNLCIDTRRYEELVSFQAEGYSGEFTDLSFLAVVTLHLKDAAASKAYFDWTKNEVMPNMMETPEFLRARYYTRTHSRLSKNRDEVQRGACNNTLCIYELDSDDWLWESFTHVSESEQWRKMEGDLNFEMKKWYLKNYYPNINESRNAEG